MRFTTLTPPATRSFLTALSALSALALSANAQVPNDDCSGAIPLTSGYHTVLHAGATASGLPSSCAGTFGTDLWYSYTSPVDEMVYLGVVATDPNCFISSYHVQVFDSADCNNLNPIECNSDACANGGAAVQFFAAAGSSHLIRIGGSTFYPAWGIDIATYGQDEILGAFPVNAGATPFDTMGATSSFPAFTCNASAGADIWFVYSADCTGPVDVELCGSAFDTVLEVKVAFSTTLLCSDDYCGLQSGGTFMAQGGSDYHIRVGGVAGAMGAGTLVIAPPEPATNMTCATATPVGLGTTPFTNFCTPAAVPFGTFSCPTGVLSRHEVWFRYTATCSGLTTIDTCGSEISTFLAVEGSGQCGTGPTIACEFGTCGAQSEVSFVAVAGNDYLVHVAGSAGSSPFLGTGVLNIRVDEPLGIPVCDGIANTTGAGARFTMSGCDIAADNAIIFRVDQLPNNSNGYFVNSRDMFTVLNPGGSTGNLCIASLSMGRHSGNVLNSGLTGEIEMAPDLTMLPWPGGSVPAAAGETWYWQYWYRDAGATSNFSSARGVMFQ